VQRQHPRRAGVATAQAGDAAGFHSASARAAIAAIASACAAEALRHGIARSWPPRAAKRSASIIAISSSVSRQSAANPGQATSTLRTPRVASASSTSSVAGCSQRPAPKRDW
jgi:hypothetical protein